MLDDPRHGEVVEEDRVGQKPVLQHQAGVGSAVAIDVVVEVVGGPTDEGRPEG